tara:strand:+ start:311 stop:673 length:363 start_codon:yes stop_codon:yes gene_type:complete
MRYVIVAHRVLKVYAVPSALEMGDDDPPLSIEKGHLVFRPVGEEEMVQAVTKVEIPENTRIIVQPPNVTLPEAVRIAYQLSTAYDERRTDSERAAMSVVRGGDENAAMTFLEQFRHEPIV